MKQPASGDDRAGDNKNKPRAKEPRRGRTSVSNNSSSQNLAGAKRPRRSPSTSPSGPPPRAATRTIERERPIHNTRPDPPIADMHVLVPVKDVVAVPLTDISQAAADSLGGGEATRVSIERFCKTLESVCRTDFSVKVDRANAGLVLGGRRYGNTASRSRQTRAELGAPAASEIATTAASLSTAEQANAGADGKGRRGKWGMSLRRGKRSKEGDGGEKAAPSAQKREAAAGKKRSGGSSGAGKRRNGGGDADSADEIAVVPLLQLVEELVQNAMFSPIGARDVMMSQARSRTGGGVIVPWFEVLGERSNGTLSPRAVGSRAGLSFHGRRRATGVTAVLLRARRPSPAHVYILSRSDCTPEEFW